MITQIDTTGYTAPNSWLGYGFDKTGSITPATSPYFQFAVNTSNFTQVKMSFALVASTNGPTSAYLYYSTDGSTFTQLGSSFVPPTSSFALATGAPFDFTGLTSTTGVTYFRIFGLGALNKNKGADLSLDDIIFSGTSGLCPSLSPPTISKSFGTNPVAINGTSTLTFTLSNPNTSALSGVQFSDTFPAGLEVANPTGASTTCSSATFSPTAGATTISLTGASIPASSSCTAQVDVKATTAGAHDNVSGYVSSTNGGTNTGPSGIAAASLTALLPPSISKSFSPNPILAGTSSTLTFTITNPNQNDALTGVAFNDVFPVSPGNMTVANPTGATTSGCGSPVFSPSSGSGSISFSGGTIVAGGTCTVSLNVTAPAAGSYDNTSQTVTSTNAGTGNTTNAALTVNASTPALTLLKQVSTSPTGPWTKYITVTGGSNVYYQFTIENTGNVALDNVFVNDTTITTSGCTFTDPLNVGDTTTCVVGPITASSTLGTYSNTATAGGDYSGTTHYSSPSTASYALPAPDFSVTKVNDVGGSITGIGTPFNWTLIVRNSKYADGATFNDGEVILRDNLPSGAAYGGTVTVTNGSVAPGGTGTILCSIASNTLTCSANGGTVVMDPEASFNATFSVTPAAAGDLTNPPGGGGNVCEVDPDGHVDENNETNNTCSDSVSINLLNTPDLRVTKGNNTSNSGVVGTQFTWNIVVSNSGTGSADFTNGQKIVSDTLPANATYGTPSAGSFTGVTNSGAVSCAIALGVLTCTANGSTVTIAAGGSFTVSLDATPTAAGSQVNTASVDPDGHVTESNETNNSGSSTVVVSAAAEPDMQVVKSNNTSDAGVVGTQFTWNIVVSNSGTGSADFTNGQKIVSDTLPANATYGTPSAGSFTGVTNSGAVSCAIALGVLTCTANGSTVTIAAGGNFTVSLDATPTAAGSQVNTANVDPDGHVTESNETNNSGSSTVVVSAAALVDLQVVKSNDTADAGVVGTTFNWSLVISNAGADAAAFTSGQKIVSDTLPTGATYGTPSAGSFSGVTNSGAVKCEITGGALNCIANGFTVTIGAGGNFTVSLSVTPTAGGSLANTAVVDPDGNITETNETNNSSTNTVTVTVGGVDLAITVTDGVVKTTTGAILTYTLSYDNYGDVDATGVTITQIVPQNSTFDAGSSSAGWVCDPTSGTGGAVCTMNVGTLASKASGSKMFVVTVSGSLPPGTEYIRGDVSITDDGLHGPDATPDNNNDADVDLLGTSTKQLLFSSNHPTNTIPSVSIGEILTYEVALNIPAGVVNNLTYTDTLDRGLVFLDASPASLRAAGISGASGALTLPAAAVSSNPDPSTNPADAGNQVSFDFGQVTSTGDNVLFFRYRAVVLDSAENVRGVQLENHGTWYRSGSSPVNVESAPVVIVEPSLSVVNTVDRRSVEVGDIVTYTLTIDHNPQSDTDAFDVTLTDLVPNRLEYLPGSLIFLSGVTPVIDESKAPTLSVTWSTYARGSAPTVLQFSAIVKSLDLKKGIINTATLIWSSLPHDYQSPQSGYNNLSVERYFDPASAINSYGTSSAAIINPPGARGSGGGGSFSTRDLKELPRSGFPPHRVTVLDRQPESLRYHPAAEIWVDIPALGVRKPVVGVPLIDGAWDVSWLEDRIGYLEGTAFPAWRGNSVLTAHVYGPNGEAGPFIYLSTLKWGDRIIVESFGEKSIYEVRQVVYLGPQNFSVLQHETYAWLTLITCRGYDENMDDYKMRVAVRAVKINTLPK